MHSSITSERGRESGEGEVCMDMCVCSSSVGRDDKKKVERCHAWMCVGWIISVLVSRWRRGQETYGRAREHKVENKIF